MIRAVVLDIGETVLNDTNNFGRWADWLGVPRHTFSAVLGALRMSGRPTNEVFRVFRPNTSYAEIVLERGGDATVYPEDFYPDVVPVLAALRELGKVVGLAGNQSSDVTSTLSRLELPVAFIECSSALGAEKPDRRFFDRLLVKYDLEASETIYVGDNYRNDVQSPRACGLRTAFLVRGPWAHLDIYHRSDLREADHILHGLAELIPIVTEGLEGTK